MAISLFSYFRITISFTVDAEKQGPHGKDEDYEPPELPPKPNLQEYKSPNFSSPIGLRSRKSNKRKVQMTQSQDKPMFAKKSSKFLMQMRSPRVKDKAWKRFSARIGSVDCYMVTLPDSMLNKIIRYLDGKTLIKLGCVCSHFRLLCNNEQVWEDLFKRSQLQQNLEKQLLLKKADVLLVDNRPPRTYRSSGGKSPRGEELRSSASDGDVDSEAGDEESADVSSEDLDSSGGASAVSWKLRYRNLIVSSRRELAAMRFLSEELLAKDRKEEATASSEEKGENEKEIEKEKEKAADNEKEDETISGWQARIHSITIKGRNTQPQFAIIIRKANGSKPVAGEAAPLRILMFSTSEDAETPVRVPFIVTRSTGMSSILSFIALPPLTLFVKYRGKTAGACLSL